MFFMSYKINSNRGKSFYICFTVLQLKMLYIKFEKIFFIWIYSS